MKNLAIFLLFVTLAAGVEIESNGQNVEKKQEKRGISSLGYAYGAPGLGYDSGFGYATPVSYSRAHYTTGGYNGNGYSGYSGYSPYSVYNGLGYNSGYNGLYNGGYNSAYNGGYSTGYSGIYNRHGLGYSGLGSGYSTFGNGYNGYNTIGNGYSGLGYSGGYSSVYPYSRVGGLVGSSAYTGYGANGGYVY